MVFHHVPKCAGTSLLQVLGGWYTLVRDYRRGWDQRFGPPADQAALDGQHCLCGHFDEPGVHLARRYPSVLGDPGCRVFAFVREPLDRVLSLYRWEGRTGFRRDDHLPRFVRAHAGGLAAALGVTGETYRRVLDRYVFLAPVAALPQAVGRLARVLEKPPPRTVPRLNVTDPHGRMPHRRRLRSADIAAFEAAATLDYAVYEYCCRRYARLTEDFEAASGP